MRRKQSAQSSGPGLYRFHDGSLLLPFRTWEERHTQLAHFHETIEEVATRHYDKMFSWSPSAKKRRTQRKLPIDSSKPILPQSRPKKARKVAELLRKWDLSCKVSWISSLISREKNPRPDKRARQPPENRKSLAKKCRIAAGRKNVCPYRSAALDDARRSDRKD